MCVYLNNSASLNIICVVPGIKMCQSQDLIKFILATLFTCASHKQYYRSIPNKENADFVLRLYH